MFSSVWDFLSIIWDFVKDPDNRAVLSWIGGGIAADAAGIWAVVRFRARHTASDFKVLWPGLSKLLAEDIAHSVEVATRFRTLRSGEWPTQNDRLRSPGKVSDHRQTIKGYDPQLARALKRYFDADAAMRRVAAAYKGAVEKSRLPGGSWTGDRIEQNVRRCSLALELRADELGLAAQRRNELTKPS